MSSLMTTLIVLVLGAVLVDAQYRYYYTRPSYRGLNSKIEDLERKVNLLKQPVHVYVSGNGDQTPPSTVGTHIHVHVTADGKQAALKDEFAYATCHVQPNSENTSPHNVQGRVSLRQKPSSQIEMKVDLEGFRTGGDFGFHVHEAADLDRGCNSFGGHFNPYGKNHGGPQDDERHVGDWGNLHVGADGSIQTTLTDRLASLFGSESIVGRGIVIHAGTDDLGRGGDAGSLKTGNAGSRVACCVIGWAKDGPW